MLRFEGLIELIKSVDKDQSDIHIHTTGNGVTPDKALALKEAGVAAVGVALDDVNPKRHDFVKGIANAYEEAIQTLKLLKGAGLFTYINMYLTSDMAQTDELHKFFWLAKSLGVGFVQFLEPKPCGGHLDKGVEENFSDENKKVVTDFFRQINFDKKYKDYPVISYQALFEKPEHLGCMMAGHCHFHIDSLGNVAPCVFMPVSFGNIMEEDFRSIFERMRKAIPIPIYEECPAITFSHKIREKKNFGSSLPLSFSDIESDWRKMYQKS
jgi:MoaA/NifB/PqqE/SkfB family radical SAM enzyme